jgi:drug/metabolite transporter (DMT)-like permease
MHVIAAAGREKGAVQWRLPLALATVYLAWGGTYPAIRVMVETVPPLLGTGIRFLLAGVILAAYLAARRGLAALRVPRRELAGAAAVGVVILGDIGVLAVAEREVPAGLAALVIASVPLWVILLRLADRQRVERLALAAVAFGFAGIAILVLPGRQAAGAPLLWLAVLLVAALVEAAGQFGAQRTRLPRDGLVSTTVQLVAAGAALIVAGAALGEVPDLRLGAFSWDSLLAFAYLVGPGSLLAYTAFVWLLANARISTVATYAYVNPVVAVVVGWALLGEPITATIAVGALAILASVAVVVRSGTEPGR